MKETPEIDDDFEDVDNLHQIQNRYTFWYRGGSASAAKTQSTNYNDSIKKISNFQTVEHFWRIYDYLKRPNDFRFTTEYHLFKEGITPTWEDPQNKAGGKWMVRLKKGISSRYWEDVILAIIGEQFDVGPEICGAVLSVRNSEDIISVWNKSADNIEAVNKIRDQLHRVLRLPSVIQIEYKKHQDSLVDKSSYRNPSLVWRAASSNTRPPYGSNPSDGGGGKPYNGSGGYNRSSYTPSGEGGNKGWKSKADTNNATEETGGGGWSNKPKEYVPRSASDTNTGGSWGNKPANSRSASESTAAPPSSGGWRSQSSTANTGGGNSTKNTAATNALKAAIAPPIPSSSTGASGNAWTRSKPNISSTESDA